MRFLAILYCCFFGVSFATSSGAQKKCGDLNRQKCSRKKTCAWSDEKKKCTFAKAKCSDRLKRDDCRSADECVWVRNECAEKGECKAARSKSNCFARRREGCRLLRIDKKLKCLNEDDLTCEELSPNAVNCRKMKKCMWQKRGRRCISDPASRCPDCFGVQCPLIKCSKDAVSVIPDGECCATCVLKRPPGKCKKSCKSPRCLEGEKVVQEPNECCPTCKKTCPCSERSCSSAQCPPLLCRKDEELVATQGGCCNDCVKKPNICKKEKCRSTQPCNVGEEVVTESRGCCLTCQTQETCPTAASAVCDFSHCALVSCVFPECDPKTEVQVTLEGECCPQCFPKFPKIDCSLVRCGLPQCKEGERAVQKPGDCCLSCQKACTCAKDCTTVKCAIRQCGPDQDPVPFANGCCNSCIDKAQCLVPCDDPPHCNEGQVLFREPGACCPSCKDLPCIEEPPVLTPPIPPHCIKPDCTKVLCAKPQCSKNEFEFTPFGECCPICKEFFPCPAIPCPVLDCPPGFMVVDDPTKCCPECLEECDCPEPGSVICPKILKPVECNGCTYDNMCLAAAAGFEETECKLVNNACFGNDECNTKAGEICYNGFDEQCDVDCGDKSCPGKCVVEVETKEGLCGGIAGIPCPRGSTCVDAKGDKCSPNCNGADCGGICIFCPDSGNAICPRVVKPVDCGGCTYTNSCLAKAAGFEEFECKLVDKPPSDVCYGNDDCDTEAGEICYTGFNGEECDVDCGDKSCPGKCVVEVETTHGLCGGIAGFPCPEGSRCVDAKGDNCSPNCGGADCGGICISCPDPGSPKCTKILKPVECNGCTYSNLCLAEAAGFKEFECIGAVKTVPP